MSDADLNHKMRDGRRQAAWDLTGGICFYCQLSLIPDDKELSSKELCVFRQWLMQLDHKLPLARGGRDSQENRVPCCGFYNAQKHKKTVEEYRTYLLQHGVVPRFFGDHSPTRDWLLVASFVPSKWPRGQGFSHPHHAEAVQ